MKKINRAKIALFKWKLKNQSKIKHKIKILRMNKNRQSKLKI